MTDLDVADHDTRDDIDLCSGAFWAGDHHEALTWLRAVVRFRFARLPRWAEPVQQPHEASGEEQRYHHK